jgi:hypothetical protein
VAEQCRNERITPRNRRLAPGASIPVGPEHFQEFLDGRQIGVQAQIAALHRIGASDAGQLEFIHIVAGRALGNSEQADNIAWAHGALRERGNEPAEILDPPDT